MKNGISLRSGARGERYQMMVGPRFGIINVVVVVVYIILSLSLSLILKRPGGIKGKGKEKDTYCR